MDRTFFVRCLFGSILALVATVPKTVHAQITFEKTYGGIHYDEAAFVWQTSDAGYIIAGHTQHAGGGEIDIYLVKTDSFGDTLWTRSYGGAEYDDAFCIQQTSDAGYVVVGYTKSFGAGDRDVYVIKTDSLGDTLWTRTYGGGSLDEGCYVQQTPDLGYVVTGSAAGVGGWTDVYLIRIDSLGNTVWTRSYGGADPDRGYSVQQTSDQGYVVVGATYSFGPGWDDVYLVKTSSAGDTVWTATYGGGADDEVGNSVQQTEDEGYIVVGHTRSFGAGGMDIYLVKTDSLGNTIWEKTYGGLYYDGGESVRQTPDSGYAVAGWTESFSVGSFDAYLVKTDATGETLWTRAYGGWRDDRGKCIQQTSDGGYVITGWTQSFGAGGKDVYLIKTDEYGMVQADVGVVTLESPGDTVFTDSTYPVMATVENLGPGFPSFYITVTIDGYVDTVRVLGLPPDSLKQVSFKNWQVPPSDSTAYTMTVCTYALGDIDTTNDCAQKSIFAYNPVGVEKKYRPKLEMREFGLGQCEPNPFQHLTVISYSVPTLTQIILEIYDITGRLVETLVNETQEPGIHQVRWNNKVNPSGVYFYRLKAGEFVETRKMVVVD